MIKKPLWEYINAIQKSGKTIYDEIEIGDPDLWIPTPALQKILHSRLQDESLSGLPLRTRSKVLKQLVCDALGYPRPKTFKKTQPRFPGQQFDTYAQKSNNLQIWNEELSPTRRYVMVNINDEDIIDQVKVVTGASLAEFDTTGTLTQKYQARLKGGDGDAELISKKDTSVVSQFINPSIDITSFSPIDDPEDGSIIPIEFIFDKLKELIGVRIDNVGSVQERNRGAELHKHVCKHLGYKNYHDAGQFPDIRHQLLEIKLQTSSTIDLGLVKPDSEDFLDTPKIKDINLRHCDVRYAIFKGIGVGKHQVKITNFYLTTGKDFFSRFYQFQGKVLNKKLQISLPSNFFSSETE